MCSVCVWGTVAPLLSVLRCGWVPQLVALHNASATKGVHGGGLVQFSSVLGLDWIGYPAWDWGLLLIEAKKGELGDCEGGW